MQSGGTVTSPSASVDVHLRKSSIAAGCNDELYVTGFPPSILQLRNESISERTNARYYNKETTTAIISLLFLRNLMLWRKATNMFHALQHCVGASIVGCHLVTKRLSRTEYGTDCVSVWPFSTLVRCTPYQLKMD